MSCLEKCTIYYQIGTLCATNKKANILSSLPRRRRNISARTRKQLSTSQTHTKHLNKTMKWSRTIFIKSCSGSYDNIPISNLSVIVLIGPRREKTGLRGFRPGPTQTGLYKLRKELEAWNFGFKKKRNCTIRVAKTKALISFAVTAKLICAFVFA